MPGDDYDVSREGGPEPSGATRPRRRDFLRYADLGQLDGAARTVPLSIGLVRTPAVSYQGQSLRPWWTTSFSTWQDMLGFFLGDLPAAQSRADRLDARITGDARAAGGTAYAGLCAIALRQAYGGTELVAGPKGQPWAFLKEISSDGNVSTVDVLYPALAGLGLRRPQVPGPAAGAAAHLRRVGSVAADVRPARPGFRLPGGQRPQ